MINFTIWLGKDKSAIKIDNYLYNTTKRTYFDPNAKNKGMIDFHDDGEIGYYFGNDEKILINNGD